MSWRRVGRVRYVSSCGRYRVTRTTEGGSLVLFALWQRSTGERLGSWPYLAEAFAQAERL